MKDIIDNYNVAKQAIYNHVGFPGEDWVFYPIDDHRDAFWNVNDEEIRFSLESKDNLINYLQDKDYDGNDIYSGSVYTQRFYKQWIYRGEKYTMIMTDYQTDGMKYFDIFDNEKEVKI